MSRPTDGLHRGWYAATAGVWVLLGVLVWSFSGELRWSAGEIGNYLEGGIGSPPEHSAAHRAKRLIERDEALEEARRLLEQSLDIDPRGEAVLGMARYLYTTHGADRARAAFEEVLELDPSCLEAYLKISAIHERRGETAAARAALERGLRVFEREAERYVARTDPDVDVRFNLKARGVQASYEGAVATLRRELARLAALDAGTLQARDHVEVRGEPVR